MRRSSHHTAFISLGIMALILAASCVSIVTVSPRARALILYDSGNPTPEEQLVLEYINRARANPVAEGQRLGIDIHEGLQDNPPSCYGPEYVGPRPPLALNPLLLSAAESHSENMYNQNYFSHTDPNGTTAFQRISNTGYNYISAGENIGAGTGMSATDLEDLLMTDSGYPCRAHRMNLLDIFPYPPPSYYEVGIGYYEGPSGQAFITQDFGTSVDATPLLTGVVFNDANGNGFYDIGEGIAGVTITPSTGSYHAITSPSGGYAFPIPTSGTITVTASGNGIGPITQTVTLTGTNVELDFTPQGGSITSQATTQTTIQTTASTTLRTNTQTTSQTTTPYTSTTQTQTQLTTNTYTSSGAALLQSVNFQSFPSAFHDVNSPGTITACGSTYTSSQSTNTCQLNFNATANLPSPSTGWEFSHWAWAGGVACASNTANPVGCSAYNSGGVLVANYAAQFTVVVNPVSLALVSLGPCTGSELSNGILFYSTDFGSGVATACNVATGYTFSSWSCSGGITCEASQNPTKLTFLGPGTIKLTLQPQQVSTTSNITSASTSIAIETTSYTSQLGEANTEGTISQASVSLPVALTPVPGFPWGSIMFGLILGMLALAAFRRRR